MREDIIDRIDDEAALLENIANGKTTASTFICEISALRQPRESRRRASNRRAHPPSAEASKLFLAGVVCRERKRAQEAVTTVQQSDQEKARNARMTYASAAVPSLC